MKTVRMPVTLSSGVLAALLAVRCVAADTGAVPGVEVSVQAEVREVNRDAKPSTYRLQPAVRVPQGTRLHYTVAIRNTTDKALKDLVVVRPIPDHTLYVRESATGAGADIAVSTDGGQNFTTQQSRCAAPQDEIGTRTLPCTHLRWRLRHPLAPGAVVLARFAVVFQ